MNNHLSGQLPDLIRSRVQRLKLSGNKFQGTSMLEDAAFWETDLAGSLNVL